MRRFLQSRGSIPLLLAILTYLGYGLLSYAAGFHWDDWGFAWAARFLGPEEFLPSFSGFRPFLGPIFFITTSLIPPVPLYWQIFALIVRFIIGISAWWALRSFWPHRPRLALTVALFVLVFPGYSQHWVALTHINQELIPFIFYLLSFGVSAHAIRRHSVTLAILALLLQFWGLFPTEYFFGMEPLRLILIWSMIDGADWLSRLRRSLALWLPYLLLWLADGIWLVLLYRSDTYISYGIGTIQKVDIFAWIMALADSILKAGFVAWGQILFLTGSTLPSPTSLLTLGVIASSFALLIFYGFFSQAREPGEAPSAWHLLLIGLAGILLGRLPSLAAGLPLTLQSVFDRFMISMTLGAGLFAAALLELLLGRHQRLQWTAVSLLVALGIGQQFYNSNLYRRDWARQQEIFWQMTWRMPALKPDTLILTSVIPDMPLETDLSFTAPLNWIYAPSYTGGNLPYVLLYTEARLGGGALPELRPDLQVTLPFRTVSFHGSTDAALVILVPQNGCLRVLDPDLGDAQNYEKESDFLIQAIPLSKPSQINADAPPLTLPDPPFGQEPAHNWCFFYEQADLARQVGDWQSILELEKQARSAGYTPDDPFEWLPFIEAQARVGDVEHAMDLSRDAFKASPRVRKGLCNLWERVETSSEKAIVASQMQGELDCLP